MQQTHAIYRTSLLKRSRYNLLYCQVFQDILRYIYDMMIGLNLLPLHRVQVHRVQVHRYTESRYTESKYTESRYTE